MLPIHYQQCYFLQALRQGQALEVEMNNLRSISFTGHTHFRTIGTRNLNGCTAIILVSEFSALICHISPLPYSTPDPHAGEAHMRNMLMRVCHKIENFDRDFYSAGRVKAGIVCAAVGGQIALPDQQRMAEAVLMRVCRVQNVRTFCYDVGRRPRTGAKGTVFVDGGRGFGKVFVEDREVEWFKDL